MNFKRNNKTNKWGRIVKELEEDQKEIDAYNPEVGADLRWSIISLLRAIAGLK